MIRIGSSNLADLEGFLGGIKEEAKTTNGVDWPEVSQLSRP